MAVNYIDTIKDAQGNEFEIHAASDSILGAQIKSSVITAVKLSKSAVTSEKIKDGAVTSAKLASDVLSMIQGAGVDTLNTLNGAITIRTGSTDGTIQIATSSEYSTVSVAGLGTAAFSTASSFAPAYNYVKTVNGSAPDSSGNVNVSGTAQSLSAQDISYGEATVDDELGYLESNKANLSSPTFTGTPLAPTALPSTSTTQIATTAFVHQVTENHAFSAGAITYSPSDSAWQVANVKDALDSLNSAQRNVYASQVYLSDGTTTVATALVSQSSAISSVASSVSSFQSSIDTLSSAIANLSASDISYGESTVADALSNLASVKADLASPTFTGTPKAPTASSATNNTQIATTAFVQSAISTKADIASPTFTGVPTAPTATSGTSTTQIATTAFVQRAISNATTQSTRTYCQVYTPSNTSALTSTSSEWITRTLASTDTSMAFESSLIGVVTYSAGGIKIPRFADGIYNIRAGMYCPAHASAPTGVYIFAGSTSATATELYGVQTISPVATYKECQITTYLYGNQGLWVKGRCWTDRLGTSTATFGSCYLYAELVDVPIYSSSSGGGTGDVTA